MKQLKLNLLSVITFCLLLNSCESQNIDEIQRVVNDKDYYYENLYTIHQTKVLAKYPGISKSILEKTKQLKISKLSEICENRINEFQSIDGAVEYLLLECYAVKHYNKVIQKFGIDFIDKNSKTISTEFFKLHSPSKLKQVTLNFNND